MATRHSTSLDVYRLHVLLHRVLAMVTNDRNLEASALRSETLKVHLGTFNGVNSSSATFRPHIHDNFGRFLPSHDVD
jgi:hypothetical protein